MIFKRNATLAPAGRALVALFVAAALAACSSTPERPKPADLGADPGQVTARLAWSSRTGDVGFPLEVAVRGNTLFTAASEGTVIALNPATGQDLWRTHVGAEIGAGVGSDGRLAAVVTTSNELVVIEGGRVLWRQLLGAQVYTAPLVAGARVFVLAADRSVSAFDGNSGRRLWTQQRPGEPLVLRKAGVLTAVGDTLVVGQSGRLVGFNPLNGSVRWEAPIASPRGTNEIERLVDLVGTVGRTGDVVCARAFQANVGCVNAARGSVLWTKPANGAEGLASDGTLVFGTEQDGKVVAWRRSDGERAWTNERLQYRVLGTPAVLGRSVAVSDSTGQVHLLSRADGGLLGRLATDGSALAAAPVLAGNTLVVVTAKGSVLGFVPN